MIPSNLENKKKGIVLSNEREIKEINNVIYHQYIFLYLYNEKKNLKTSSFLFYKFFFSPNNLIDFKHSSYSLLAYSKLIYLNHSLT